MEELLRDEAEDYNKEKMCLMIMEHDTYDYAKAEANVQSSDDESSNGESDESEEETDDHNWHPVGSHVISYYTSRSIKATLNPYPGHQNSPKALYSVVFGPKSLNI